MREGIKSLLCLIGLHDFEKATHEIYCLNMGSFNALEYGSVQRHVCKRCKKRKIVSDAQSYGSYQPSLVSLYFYNDWNKEKFNALFNKTTLSARK
jgi:hypothetical protein